MMRPADHVLFRRLCDAAAEVVLTTHIQPDGDALGSEVGLARYLLSLGKRVRLVNQDPTPESLRFLEAEEHRAQVYDPGTHDALLRASPLVVLVDNSAPDRLGRMERILGQVAGATLCIDHHPAREMPWAHRVVDESFCATAAVVYHLTRAAGWSPDALAAQALYTGLATDTGFFRFNSTGAEAYAMAAELVRLGAEPARVYREVYERNSLAYTRLLGHALAGVRLPSPAVASIVLPLELIRGLDAEEVDTSEITTALLAMDGIMLALLFREMPSRRVKISLRSKGTLDVHGLAAEFGGGGHRNASGIVTEGVLEGVATTVTERAVELARRGGS
jgi:phosphoesterase RecJ-like protein